MPLTAVVLFDSVGQILADVVFADRQSAIIGLIIVGAVKQDFPGFQALKQTV